MKNIFISSLLTLLAGVSYSQPLCDFKGKDSLFVFIVGDTVQVWDIAACGYCNSSFAVSVDTSADTVYIVQTDTVTNTTLCGCLFNLNTSIVGLPAGTYHILLYRHWPETGIHKFIRSIQFTYTPISQQLLQWSGFQSGCIIDEVVEEDHHIPKKYALFPNYPNPFNPGTTITYEVGETEYVVIRVYDVLGKKVATLVSANQSPGIHSVKFNMNDNQSSGIYFCTMRAGSFTQTKIMVFQR